MTSPYTCRYCQQPITDSHAAQRRYCTAACKQAAYRVRQNQQQRRPAPWAAIDWIIGHFPAHHTYVEPWSDHAAVLLRKPPARAVVLNDWNGELRVFAQAAQHDRERLIELTALTIGLPATAIPSNMHPNHSLVIARQVLMRSWSGAAPLYARRTARRPSEAGGLSREALVEAHLSIVLDHLNAACLLGMEPAELIQQTAQPGALLYGELPALPGAGLSLATARQYDPIRRCLRAIEEYGATAVLSGKRNPTDHELLAGWSQVTRDTPGANLSGADVIWVSPGALKSRMVGGAGDRT
ncbi:MAG TPA: hypothetical protein VGE07_30225 [Herpetosiphonaceae bacterium]